MNKKQTLSLNFFIKLAKKYESINFFARFSLGLFEYLTNLVGHIPSHTIRDTFYRELIKVKLPKSSVIFCRCKFFQPWTVNIGNNTFIGNDAFLDGRKGLYIGSNVNIAAEARIYTMEHDINSPTFEGTGNPVHINDWVYIGARVTILPGVTVGEGAVIASGAVVTKDVEPWTMVGGIPAKFIKNRKKVKYQLDTSERGFFM